MISHHQLTDCLSHAEKKPNYCFSLITLKCAHLSKVGRVINNEAYPLVRYYEGFSSQIGIIPTKYLDTYKSHRCYFMYCVLTQLRLKETLILRTLEF